MAFKAPPLLAYDWRPARKGADALALLSIEAVE